MFSARRALTTQPKTGGRGRPGPRARRRSAKALPHLELLEQRLVLDFRSISGFGNNLAHPSWGQAGTDLIRLAPAAYGDGISSPAGANRPGARLVSNTVSDQTDPNNPSQDLDTVNQKLLTDYIYFFGQFLDHDIDLTGGQTGANAEQFPIPPGSATDPIGTEPFTRSEFDPNTGTSTSNPRQQLNEITAFIDGSQIYGSDQTRANQLRTFSGGQLKQQIQSDGAGGSGNFLPYNNATFFGSAAPLKMANDAGIVPDTALYAAGDVRANENIELTAMQTLFMREHNRIAAQLQAQNPTWSDETLYQMARRQVGAELQIITYRDWLPALLGPNPLPAYTGYNPNVNPGIANEFSTAMFRFAHSQLDNSVDRLNNDGTDITTDPAGATVDLSQAFFNPTLINLAGVTDPFSGHKSTGINPILKGGASGIAQEVDLLAVRDIRNFLFGPPGAGGTDLIARDIQRGRDHGLTDYNSMRAAYGLPRVTSFAQITANVAVQQKLQQLYGTVNNIDVFVGALAEDHVAGADVGPLTKAVLVNQFTRLRDGDRFFYQNPNAFSAAEQSSLLANTSLAQIIERNTAITDLQANVFVFSASLTGTVYVDPDGNGVAGGTEPGLQGVTVQLHDGSGAVVGTAVTNASGRYTFNGFNGLAATGDYTVSLVLPAGLTQTADQVANNPGTILIDNGGRTVSGADFGVLGTKVNYLNGFANPAGLQRNGSAAVSGSVLRLTNGGGSEAASTFTTTAVTITKFSTFFTFQLTNASADGFTFTIQRQGPTALGSSGGGLGYATDGSGSGAVIHNSAAIKFDLFNNQGEGNDSTGLYFNGAAPTVPAVDLSNTGINLHSGDLFEGRISYDGSTLTLRIDDDFTGAAVIVTYSNVNIPAAIGGTTAFVGFTAGTGGLTATQDIQAWNFTSVTGSGTAPGSGGEGGGPVALLDGSVAGAPPVQGGDAGGPLGTALRQVQTDAPTIPALPDATVTSDTAPAPVNDDPATRTTAAVPTTDPGITVGPAATGETAGTSGAMSSVDPAGADALALDNLFTQW